MTTALDIVTGALLDLGAIGLGEVPEGDQADRAFKVLNDLLESLSAEHLLIYTDATTSLAMDGASSYTMGLTGDINLDPAMKITSAYYRLSGIDYPVDVVTQDEFDSIGVKTLASSVVAYLYVKYGYPSALYNTLYVYPQPSSGTLFINYWGALSSFASLNTTVVLPKAYKRMLRLCLAVELMPSYGSDDAKLPLMALDSKSSLKRVNNRTKVLVTSTPVSNNYSGGGVYRIQRGY